MKPRPRSPRDFLPSVAAISRATCAAAVVGLAGGILLVIAGFVAAQPQWLIVGGGTLALAAAGWVWSRRPDEELPEQVIEQFAQNGPSPDEQRAAELLALLTEWEAIEEKRGSREFDPWALQSLRNDIRRVVESDPALEQLFSDLRRAA